MKNDDFCVQVNASRYVLPLGGTCDALSTMSCRSGPITCCDCGLETAFGPGRSTLIVRENESYNTADQGI